MTGLDIHACEIFYLAFVLWREARGESRPCQIAVACSVRNRVLRPSWWGRNYIDVITKKWQYSSLTDPKDPQLTKWPNPITDRSFAECYDIARDVLEGKVASPAPGADSYFDISIPNPSWATDDKFVIQLGRIKFYNMDGDYETAAIPVA